MTYTKVIWGEGCLSSHNHHVGPVSRWKVSFLPRNFTLRGTRWKKEGRQIHTFYHSFFHKSRNFYSIISPFSNLIWNLIELWSLICNKYIRSNGYFYRSSLRSAHVRQEIVTCVPLLLKIHYNIFLSSLFSHIPLYLHWNRLIGLCMSLYYLSNRILIEIFWMNENKRFSRYFGGTCYIPEIFMHLSTHRLWSKCWVLQRWRDRIFSYFAVIILSLVKVSSYYNNFCMVKYTFTCLLR